MKKNLLIFTLVISTHSFANLTGPSLFKNMMSTNSATISDRTAATFSVVGQNDVIGIEQDLSNGALGAGATYESEIKINNFRGFYGGKGGGFTSEILFEQGSGDKTDTLTSSTEEIEYATDATVTNLNANFGLWKGFGVGVTQITVNDSTSFSNTFNGNPFSMDIESKYVLSALSAGIVINLGLDIGLFYQKATLNSEIDNGGQVEKDDQNQDRAGFGIGYNSKSFRIEAGYVKKLEADDRGDDEKVNPSMAEFTTEMSFGKLRIGYTGRYFMDGFFQFSGVIYDVLAYSSVDENRLENSINFAYGDDSKGHSFSGSFSSSTVESEQTQRLIDDSGTKYDTTTTSQSMSLSYLYSF